MPPMLRVQDKLHKNRVFKLTEIKDYGQQDRSINDSVQFDLHRVS